MPILRGGPQLPPTIRELHEPARLPRVKVRQVLVAQWFISIQKWGSKIAHLPSFSPLLDTNTWRTGVRITPCSYTHTTRLCKPSVASLYRPEHTYSAPPDKVFVLCAPDPGNIPKSGINREISPTPKRPPRAVCTGSRRWQNGNSRVFVIYSDKPCLLYLHGQLLVPPRRG